MKLPSRSHGQYVIRIEWSVMLYKNREKGRNKENLRQRVQKLRPAFSAVPAGTFWYSEVRLPNSCSFRTLHFLLDYSKFVGYNSVGMIEAIVERGEMGRPVAPLFQRRCEATNYTNGIATFCPCGDKVP